MHPILLRIPLPHTPLKLWWALVAVAVIALVNVALAQRKGDKSGAIGAFVLAAAAGAFAYLGREIKFEALNLPIYSYGVMLGLSLVVGWYLSLTLAERDGLPKEEMANCYVVTALAAIAGSRILYIATNIDEFNSVADLFAFRKGGLVAYGGFLGGFVGSAIFLASRRIKLMPWADVAVPSLASGLLVTRIGCYLFGCDFGKRLSDTSPDLLKKLGTFPHWAPGMVESGEGSPAFVRHIEQFRDSPLGEELLKSNASLPVHPTQLYESACGLLLLVILLSQRKYQQFRGQIFLTFVFAYGFLRFLLELLRDDVERGEYGPLMSEHVLVPGALTLMALGFVFGIALGIRNHTFRTLARALAFVPPLATFIVLKPPSFAATVDVRLSTSQWIALITSLLAAYFYASFWETARRNPERAMSPETLGEGAIASTDDSAASDSVDDLDESGEPGATQHDGQEQNEPMEEEPLPSKAT